jgi:YidC/Oxa1 family membrane protein insertase
VLGDDSREKEIFRNQFIAIALMTILLVVWMQFFMPPPPVQPPPSQETETTVDISEPEAEDDISTAGLATAPADAEEAFDLAPAEPASDPAADEVAMESAELRLVFTRVGARLKRAELFLGERHNNVVEQLVPQPAPGTPDSDAVYPLGLGFSNESLRGNLNRVRWEVLEQSDQHVVFTLELPGEAEVRKTFRFGGRPHVIESVVEYTNTGGRPARLGIDDTPAYVLSWAPNVDSHDMDKGIQQGVVWRTADANENLPTADLVAGSDGAPFQQAVRDPEWVAVKSAYFVVAMRPRFEASHGRISGADGSFALGLTVPRVELAPGATQRNSFEVYVGPNAQQYLAQAWETLPSVQQFFTWPGIMDRFAKFLLRCLNWIEEHVYSSYGVAIILLTLAVRVLMIPLTLKQVKSMKMMQLVAPELKEIQEKHKDEPQVLQQKMMELYRERGVNPFGGCLPLLVQMPVFIALYRMLWSAYELRGAPFLWIEDLSMPDRLVRIPGMEHVPFIGGYFEYLNILPLLGAVAMVLSTRLMPQSPMVNQQQKLLMTILPIGFSLMFYNWAAGLNLYVLTSTVLGIVQTHLTRVAGPEVEAEVKKKKKPARKRRHFYTAAQSRKKRLAKETSKGNGAKGSKSGAEKGKGPKKASRKDS